MNWYNVLRSLSSQQTHLPMDISVFSPLHINKILWVEWRICFSPPFHFSLELSVTVRKDRQPFSLDIPPPHHHHRLLLMQSSEGWHSNYAFFKRNCKSPHRATSSWQPNWSGIKLKRLQLLPMLCDVGKGTSVGQRAGWAVQQVQRWAPLVHLSRGRTGR